MQSNNLFAQRMNTINFYAHKIYKAIVPHPDNAYYLLISFTLAIFLWFGVIGREQVEEKFDIALDYTNLAPNLVISEGLEQSVTVRVRGPKHLLQLLDETNLSYTIDLSKLTKGANMVSIEADQLPSLRKFTTIATNPPYLLIVTEALMEKELKLEPLIMENLNITKYKISNLKIEPSRIIARGPASIVEPLERMLVPFNPGLQGQAGKYTESVAVMTPQNVQANPPLVQVSYDIERRMSRVTLSRIIQVVTDEDKDLYNLQPKYARITANIPEQMVDHQDFLSEIQLFIEPSGMSSEEIKIQAKNPKNVEVLEIKPEKITITKN